MYIKFKDGKSKALTLSYDDGVVQDIRLVDVMNKHGLKGTFNINSGSFLNEDTVREKFYGRMKLSEAKDLYLGSGHEVATHGYKHIYLTKVSPAQATYEVLHDREVLEKEFGTVCRGMAYAYGVFNDDVIHILKDCGIAYCRTTRATHSFNIPTNWLTLDPTCHHKDERLFELAEQFVNETPRFSQSWLFYVWGHSYEFDDNDNWDIIEKFAEMTGGHDDIWYATNMEIYEYVQAFNSLICSVDETIITNHTSIDVWATTYDGKTFCIKAGETLKR